MNKLIANIQGGRPLWTEDILTVEQSLLSGFQALLDAVAEESNEYCFLISGCEVTVSPPTISVAKGFVYMAGEVWEMPPQILTYNPSLYYYIEEDVQTAGIRVYADANTHPAREIRKTKISSSATALPLPNVLQVKKYIKLIQKDAFEPWLSISSGLSTSIIYATGSGTHSLNYGQMSYAIMGGTVHISINVSIDTTLTASTISGISIQLPPSLGWVFPIATSTVMNWESGSQTDFCKANLVSTVAGTFIVLHRAATIYPANSTIGVRGMASCPIQL
jgi:hypothetical protein